MAGHSLGGALTHLFAYKLGQEFGAPLTPLSAEARMERKRRRRRRELHAATEEEDGGEELKVDGIAFASILVGDEAFMSAVKVGR